jgi:hypothetical protein
MKSKIDISGALGTLNSVKGLPDQVMNQVAPKAAVQHQRNTPRGDPRYWKSKPPAGYVPGNARASTKLEGKDTINMDYPYAGRLLDGWSPQSGRGEMLKKLNLFINAEVKRVVSGLLNKIGKK